jgi:hypothetical protein
LAAAVFIFSVFASSVVSAGSPAANTCWKEFVYDNPDTAPIVYGGESRAENVHMSDYCIYLDIYYADGSVSWGERAEFASGTHGWQKVCGAFSPSKPVKRIEMNALCRGGRPGGKAEFRGFFLERREGRGERLYEARRSLRPYADGDEIFYSDFTGRRKTFLRESVPAQDAQFGLSPLASGRSEIWTADSMRRVTPLTFPTRRDVSEASIALDIARRGAASAQVLVSTAGDTEWTSGSLALPQLRTADGKAFKGALKWERVGYLPRGTYIIPHPFAPAVKDIWTPEPLLPAAPFRVRKGATQALWITATAAADELPGLYAGEIEVSEAGQVRRRVRVEVRVRSFSHPETFGLKTSFSLMDGYMRAAYPDGWLKLSREAQDILLDHRLNPDDITRTSLPRIDDLLHARKRGMNAFTILNIVPEPKDTNQLWTCYVPPSAVFNDRFYPQFKARLEPYVAELRRHGLDKIANLYGFDERGSEYYAGIAELCRKIKADFPDIPVLTSALMYNGIDDRWKDVVAGKTNVNDLVMTDIYCPLTKRWNPEVTEFLRSKGKLCYWYTCSGPRWPYANFASYEYPLIEGRLVLGFQTHLYRADGFVFWHVNCWNSSGNAPLDVSDTFFPKWLPHSSLRCPGDGVFLYPAKDRILPSVRLAQLRDGAQDWEWLELAAEKCGREAVDAVSRRLIRSLTDFTRDPAELMRARREIGDMIERAGCD